MESLTTNFLHDGTIGDCWAAMPSMKEYYKKTGKKVVIYLTNGQAAFYYEGATHPTVSPDGKTMVMLNKKMIDMMIPLFKAQPYIADAKEHNGEHIVVNLNMIRETFVNMPYHSLSKWYWYVFPDLACDLSKPYISVPETDMNFAKGKMIVARTERYINHSINYHFLKKYQDKLIFAGTELEHIIFNARFSLNIPRLIVNDFLELAQAVKQSIGLLSNQTMIAQIAEGTKSPRIVELCKEAPNVDFVGESAFEFYAQEALEYYVSILNGEAPKKPNNGSQMPPPINL